MLITKVGDHVNVEVFEVSPLNRAVITTKSRLRRSFPASGVSIKNKTFQEPQLRAVFASTMAKMSQQRVGGTQPQVKKATKFHDEERDTTHPKMITEFLVSFLMAIGSPSDTEAVWKNTREEVNWLNCFMPWKRSPIWLVTRVVLQLSFARSARTDDDGDLYKEFMAYHMSKILNQANANPAEIQSDTLFSMSAKIHRRLRKLNNMNEALRAHTNTILRQTSNILRDTWMRTQKLESHHLQFSKIKQLDFKQDTMVDIPMLNSFIDSLYSRNNEDEIHVFQPQYGLTKFKADYIPDFQAFCGEHKVLSLVAFETWVADRLESCMKAQNLGADTCAKLRFLIEDYHKEASAQYREDPESTSIMILTILELWIACDKIATEQSVLLKKYDSGVPTEILQTLLLPFKSQMERLHRVESYLQTREDSSNLPSKHVFSSFGEEKSFSVKWVQQSQVHMTLLTRIEQMAEETRRSKLIEFAKKEKNYADFMFLYSQNQCNFNKATNKHKKCPKCKFLRKADSLSIEIHEWPLPHCHLGAQSTVFELQVPEVFGHWRAVTLHVRSQVLGLDYVRHKTPKTLHKLKDYVALTQNYIPFGKGDQYIALFSEVKSNDASHRKMKVVGTSTEEDVCVKNGHHYQYYDHGCNSVVDDMVMTDKMEKDCTYMLPERSNSLQKFLSRPSDSPSGLSPNTVIATQSHCPRQMPIDEYKALCSLPLGTKIQWQNILVQLHVPFVNFKQLETTIFILQCIFQVGPLGDDPITREGHQPVRETEFAVALLKGLHATMERIKGNWQACYALVTCVSLACRLSALNGTDSVKGSCLEFLSNARETAMNWISALQANIHLDVSEKERMILRRKIFIIALVSASTFDVQGDTLRDILKDPANASTLLVCSIIVQKSNVKDTDQLTTILYRRWQRLSHRSFSILAQQISNGDGSLDSALHVSWPAYPGAGRWRRISETYDHWLVGESLTNSVSSKSLTMHFNILDGELLVNGVPLGRLPAEYERHPAYRKLFGMKVIDVMPSTIPGLRFSSTNRFSGYTLHLGMSTDSELLIRAVGKGQAYELIPSSLFAQNFPATFSEGFIHWYDIDNDCIEFRSRDNPLEPAPAGWLQSRLHLLSPWKLSNGRQSIVATNSQTTSVFAKLLGCLEDSRHMHCILDEVTSLLSIELTRLQLGFYAEHGDDIIYSRQFRGMSVDKDQSIGCLVGLCSKLVMRSQSTPSQRIVIIPHGDVQYYRQQRHTSVRVIKDSATTAYTYRVDNHLGRLIDNGSLDCKLWLCYLHALTSFCLPDPLTRRTGTEQALSILTSAAVKSFDTLTEQNIETLGMISQLSPRRQYYPVSECVMQSVVWQQELDFLAQHGKFHRLVSGLFDKHTRSKTFYPSSYIELPGSIMDGVDRRLSDRDAIRSSTFCVAHYGAEDFNTQNDCVYHSRDKWKASPTTILVTSIADAVHHSRDKVYHPLPPDPAQSLWEALSKGSDVTNNREVMPVTNLTYDASCLERNIQFITNNWLKLHRLFTTERERVNKSDIAMWLSLLAYSECVEAPLLQILAMIYNNPNAFMDIHLPADKKFSLQDGDRPIKSRVAEMILSQATMLPGTKKGRKKARKLGLDKVADALISQWDCDDPSIGTLDTNELWNEYYDTEKALLIVRSVFASCDANKRFRRYLSQLAEKVPRECITLPLKFPSPSVPENTSSRGGRRSGFLAIEDLFLGPAPFTKRLPLPDLTWLLAPDDRDDKMNCGSSNLGELISRLRARARSEYERSYVEGLDRSLASLQGHTKTVLSRDSRNIADLFLTVNKIYYEEHVHGIYSNMLKATGLIKAEAQATALHWPRLSPILFLQNLARTKWQGLRKDWRDCIIQYGLALSMLKQSDRRLACSGNESALIQELSNTGHANWNAALHPEALLLEIESDITIREVQEQIAGRMRTSSIDGNNEVMQLNMGEGKSSVIVPMVAAALADGSRLVRVIVAKPQMKQMFQMMTSKLGGLINRPIYQVPFSRDVKLAGVDIERVQMMFEECMALGGVLLVQPEHILSFQLMAVDYSIEGGIAAKSMMKTLDFLKKSARDIVDESDENFSTKFELMYTMGAQRPIDNSPSRWTCIHEVLGIIRNVVPLVKKELPDSVELFTGCHGSFSRTRLLREDAQNRTLERVASRICESGLVGLPMDKQSHSTRLAILKYINKSRLSVIEIEEVEKMSFYTSSAKHTLLLLRGLIAGDVLGFAFGQKRWRVDYGLDPTRQPTTKLAVPYRAKDNPSARSEFGHPDVVILLTSLSYYYGGLADDDLTLAFEHIKQSDQADMEYQAWVNDADDLPLKFQNLEGINLEDSTQCETGVFPQLRYGKAVIDYFLSHVVFPREMREFPQKLSASGWDIGQRKTHATTGFSGTNDSRVTLPLSVTQLDLPNQTHTNAMVLDYLLQPENTIALMDYSGEDSALMSDAERLLSMVVALKPPVRVILDVGAQILELDNLGVAKRWLDMVPDDGKTQAVVFFDANDHICVLDRKGQVQELYTSPFIAQLDRCLVFLDEAHTRGTDLRFPQDYRAAVTLGANLTKDRLVQACMRMRELGRGQSVLFCVPDEIAMNIRTLAGRPGLDVSDILEWAIRETWRDARRSIPIWAAQGRRHRHHETLWERAHNSNGSMAKSGASGFLEQEAQSLEARYRPMRDDACTELEQNTHDNDPILQRCRSFGTLDHCPKGLNEEQEREMAAEIQQERQVQRVLTATPLKHHIHPDIKHFVCTGIATKGSDCYKPALQTLIDTSAAAYLDLRKYAGALLATADFAGCVQPQDKKSQNKYVSDLFQRSVQWILTSGSAGRIRHMIIISPFEAQVLMPDIKESKYVSLHLYAPRLNVGYRPLDALDLYTLPRGAPYRISQSLVMELNLFSGQLYFQSLWEYLRVSQFFRVDVYKMMEGREPDGEFEDSQSWTLTKYRLEEQPIKFFKVLLTKLRRNCQSIDKTHIGYVLDDRPLGQDYLLALFDLKHSL